MCSLQPTTHAAHRRLENEEEQILPRDEASPSVPSIIGPTREEETVSYDGARGTCQR